MAVFRVEKTKDFVDLFLTQARLDYTKEHGKKVSIRESMKPVSYTHLDVYKRQPLTLSRTNIGRPGNVL